MPALLPALTSLLAFLFALMLLDQWRERRHGFQLVWALGMTWFAIGTGAEALAAAGGWNETLYRAWYLTGAVWTAAWLGLGTAFLLGRTRFGYTYAVLLLLSGLVALMIRNNPAYAGAGPLPLLYLIGAVILALAIGVETYFGNDTLAALRGGRHRRRHAAVDRPDGPDAAAAGARLRAEPGDRAARGRRDAGLPAPAHAGHEHPGGAVAAPGRGVLGLRVHAQEAGAGLLAGPEPAGRPVPVQPVHRPGGDRGQPGRVAAGRGARPGRRPAALAGAGDHPDRDRRVLPDDHGLPEPRGLHGAATSWASSWASCSCSPASSSRPRCSARSASRSRTSASRRAGGSAPAGATRRRVEAHEAPAPRS